MVAGRKYWIVIWYGILFLGVLGLWASLYWARRTAWKNVDEVLRAVGTILVSVGMLLLLHKPAGPLWETTGEILLVDALICFVAAFILGRRGERERAARRSGEVHRPPPDSPAAVPREAGAGSPDTSSTTVPPDTS
ncbi:MAG TPA: hypothetical protein VFU46_00045 [Gemmatimonadales bacterium]|nr:hypothetical protein [Gemmatimonadales bacterium]